MSATPIKFKIVDKDREHVYLTPQAVEALDANGALSILVDRSVLTLAPPVPSFEVLDKKYVIINDTVYALD